jgi:hypothetical protein
MSACGTSPTRDDFRDLTANEAEADVRPTASQGRVWTQLRHWPPNLRCCTIALAMW